MFGSTHLFPSLMPLSAVVPSLLTNRRRLLSGKTPKVPLTQSGPLNLTALVSHLPSVLLMSAKFWLCTIFSTMSSASMRVSSTQEGWFSTLSCFLLEGKQRQIPKEEDHAEGFILFLL